MTDVRYQQNERKEKSSHQTQLSGATFYRYNLKCQLALEE